MGCHVDTNSAAAISKLWKVAGEGFIFYRTFLGDSAADAELTRYPALVLESERQV